MKHVTEGVRMISTLTWHDKNKINKFLLHKTFNSKGHTTLATYHKKSGTPLAVLCSSRRTFCSIHITKCQNIFIVSPCMFLE